MGASLDEYKDLVGEFTFVSGDKGSLSINDNEVVINVDTHSCYRVFVYKFNFDSRICHE